MSHPHPPTGSPEGGDTDFLAVPDEGKAAPSTMNMGGILSENPSTGSTPKSGDDTSAVDPLLGRIVSEKYHVQCILGRGGMGIVYGAEQLVPVKRRVAFKVTRVGAAEGILVRFAAEREALARLDHPNVAQILDAGTIGSGRPYFVMAYVDGAPLTTYCDDRKLGIRDRLVLFQQVCAGIHHAHQKGILHRDLKPSNILVETIDNHAVPKVIDFGLAKATRDPLDGRADLTVAGEIMGTLSYMAPEQADWTSQDVDTRADIYSLGIVLYELLVGATPLEYDALMKLSGVERLLKVQESAIGKPSSFLLRSGEGKDVAERRGCSFARLRNLLRGDLDRVVMKALEKDRERRYESAAAFAEDIRRYLDGSPVLAAPPSWSYTARKFFGRNRGAVLASCAVVLAMILGTVASVRQSLIAEQARKEAEVARVDAEERRTAALEAQKIADELRTVETNLRAIAERERDEKDTALRRAEQKEKEAALAAKEQEAARKETTGILILLQTVFDKLDPTERDGTSLQEQLRKELVKVTVTLKNDYAKNPAIRAPLAVTLGNSLMQMGHPAEAEPLFQMAVEDYDRFVQRDNRESLWAHYHLAEVESRLGRLDAAAKRYRQVLAIQTEKLGVQDDDTLLTMNNLLVVLNNSNKLEEAIALGEQLRTIQIKTLGPEHVKTLTTQHNLSSTYYRLGRFQDAADYLERSRDIRLKKYGWKNLELQANLAGIGRVYLCMERNHDALAVLEKLQSLQATQEESATTLRTLHELAIVKFRLGDLVGSRNLIRKVLARRLAKLGAGHAETLQSRLFLLRLDHASGDGKSVRQPLQALIEEMEKSKHSEWKNAMALKADILRENGEFDAAMETLDRIEKTTIPSIPDLGIAREGKARVLLDLGRPAEAIAVLTPLIDLRSERCGPGSDAVVHIRQRILEAMARTDDRNAVKREAKQLLAEVVQKHGNKHPETESVRETVVTVLEKSGNIHDAIEILETALTREQQLDQPNRLREAALMTRLLQNLIRAERYEKAGEWSPLAEQLAKEVPLEFVERITLQANLARLQLAKKKFGDAEQLLLKLDKELENPPGAKHPEAITSLRFTIREDLVKLYQEMGNSKEQARWEAAREQLGPELAPPPHPK